jgi:hypothetical protein
MSNVRLNQMIKWYNNENNLNIFVDSKKITLPSQESLSTLFIDFTENFSSISIDEIILNYKIPEKLVLFLIKLNILISIDNSD